MKRILLFGLMSWGCLVAKAAPGEDVTRLFARAHQGGVLRLVALGGSITQAGGGWIGDWLARRFPACRTMVFNAGMSATGSSLGIFRLGRDVLACRPDLVLIEYCVNDVELSDEDAVRYQESLVVRLKTRPNPPAVVFIGAASKGRISFARHRRVAAHYGLAFVDLQEPLERELAEKGLAWTDLMSDEVHPNDAGHRFYADVITAALEPFARAAEQGAGAVAGEKLPKPLSLKPLLLDGELVSLASAPRDGWTCESFVGEWWDRFMTGVLRAPEARPARTVIPFCGTQVGLYYPMDPSCAHFYVSIDGREPVEVNPAVRTGYESRILGQDLAPGAHTLTIYVPAGETGPVRLAYLLTAGATEPTVEGVSPLRSFDGEIVVRPVSCADLAWRREASAAWTPLAGSETRVDFTQLAPNERLDRAFLRLVVESPMARTASLAFAIDYFGELTVNGRRAHVFNGGYGPRQRVVYPVELVSGRNELVFEIRPGSQGHACELAWVTKGES